MEHTARNVAELRNAYGDFADGIYLGQGPNGCVYVRRQRRRMVLGFSCSGKTSSLVIPNLLLANGPCGDHVNQADVLIATASGANKKAQRCSMTQAARSNVQKVSNRSVGHRSPRPRGLGDFAVQTADSMVRASCISEGGFSVWRRRPALDRKGQCADGTILHAAALESLAMRDVARWIDRHDGATPLAILASTVGTEAAVERLVGRNCRYRFP